MTDPSETALRALAEGTLSTPFDLLGGHPIGAGGGRLVRVWVPGAESVDVVTEGRDAVSASVVAPGLFEARFPDAHEAFPYAIRVDGSPAEDPYRFGPLRTDEELARLQQVDGRVHQFMGAQTVEHEGTQGTVFSVWAPAARAVSVTGSFNGWSAIAHPMRPRGTTGVWELFVPGVGVGAIYKYRVVSHAVPEPFLKSDPCGRAMQLRPDTASVVTGPAAHDWGDEAWIADRARAEVDRPMSIYEVHLSSWRREDGARPREGEPGWLDYRRLGDELIPYVAELGFTHIELLPITEHPYDGSWGYQTVGYFAPTSRHGNADDLRYLVDQAHQAGIGVILDWVPAHFPRDAHGLARFDGTALYEHADPRRGVHPDWGTYIFNYARPEVVAFLVSSALYWIEEFHLDGLRLDAVASMLYLDYSRDEGQWLPNQFGGRENMEATAFLRALNETVHREHPGVLVTAEESTAWPGVTHPVSAGGLGFDLKWNMGWMNDTLEVMEADPLFRGGLYRNLTFGITYAFSERFLLSFSHDEVVHLKQSMLRKMPGSELDQFANLRLLYGYMWTHPGKKLLFMGSEFGVWYEWDEEGELDWPLLEAPMHQGMHRWVRDLNRLYAAEPALYQTDGDGRGFEWIDCHDTDRTTLSFLRWSHEWQEYVVVVSNFTPMAWVDFRLAVPFAGDYSILLDSDAVEYGGSGTLDGAEFSTIEGEAHGRTQYLQFRLPPLSTLVFRGPPVPVDATPPEAPPPDSPEPPAVPE